ncbi:MAG: hypothetical protein WDN24_17745 [Sphingomonas sp.]
MVAYSAVFSVFTFLGAFARTPEEFAILRFIAGIGLGGALAQRDRARRRVHARAAPQLHRGGAGEPLRPRPVRGRLAHRRAARRSRLALHRRAGRRARLRDLPAARRGAARIGALPRAEAREPRARRDDPQAAAARLERRRHHPARLRAGASRQLADPRDLRRGPRAGDDHPAADHRAQQRADHLPAFLAAQRHHRQRHADRHRGVGGDGGGCSRASRQPGARPLRRPAGALHAAAGHQRPRRARADRLRQRDGHAAADARVGGGDRDRHHGFQALANSFAASYYPTSIRATGSGTTFATGRLVGVFGPILGSVFWRWDLSVASFFALDAAIVALCGVCLLVTWRHRVRGTGRAAA